MKRILLLLLLIPLVATASMRASTLEEILECSHSIFYGKVIEGKIISKSFKLHGKEMDEDLGKYKIQVIEHIAGVKQKGVVTVFAEYSAIMIGGMSYHYPTPGLEYIFITSKEGRQMEFSPYYLPRVEAQLEKKYVTDGQHAFLAGVTYYYLDQSWEMKEGTLNSVWDGDKIHDHVQSMVGYKLLSYIHAIRSKYGKCNPDE